MNDAIIKVNNISKEYLVLQRRDEKSNALSEFLFPKRQSIKAVNNISFSVKRGEAVGYIGVNGAGKSTTIKMLSGILVPTKGTIEVLGLMPYKERQKNALNIGVLFGQRSVMWWDVPVRETFRLLKRIYAIDQHIYEENLSLFDDVLEIKPLLDTPTRQLSLGQRTRVNLAAVFLHNPKVIYLDEPTIGLDILVKQRVRNFLKFMVAERRCSVILATHDLRDIEDICSRVIMIDKGQIIYDGRTDEITRFLGNTRTLIVQFSAAPTLIETELARMGSAYPPYEIDNNVVRFQVNPVEHSMTDLVGHFLNNGNVADLSIDEPDLERVVQKLYQGRKIS